MDDLDAAIGSCPPCELRWLASRLLDLGLGDVRLDAEGGSQTNVPVKSLERLVWWASDSKIIHDSCSGKAR